MSDKDSRFDMAVNVVPGLSGWDVVVDVTVTLPSGQVSSSHCAWLDIQADSDREAGDTVLLELATKMAARYPDFARAIRESLSARSASEGGAS